MKNYLLVSKSCQIGNFSNTQAYSYFKSDLIKNQEEWYISNGGDKRLINFFTGMWVPTVLEEIFEKNMILLKVKVVNGEKIEIMFEL